MRIGRILHSYTLFPSQSQRVTISSIGLTSSPCSDILVVHVHLSIFALTHATRKDFLPVTDQQSAITINCKLLQFVINIWWRGSRLSLCGTSVSVPKTFWNVWICFWIHYLDRHVNWKLDLLHHRGRTHPLL